jgi:hypothetical protein
VVSFALSYYGGSFCAARNPQSKKKIRHSRRYQLTRPRGQKTRASTRLARKLTRRRYGITLWKN